MHLSSYSLSISAANFRSFPYPYSNSTGVNQLSGDPVADRGADSLSATGLLSSLAVGEPRLHRTIER